MKPSTISIHGKKVAYWTSGSSSLPNVLFIHGFRGNHKGLAGVAKAFDRYHVIIPDLPGYGGSESLDIPHTFQAYADFLNEFCKAVGVTKPHIIGHSFGASLGLVFAAKFPKQVNKLILIAPVINATTLEGTLGRLYYDIASFLPSFLRTRWIKNRVIDFLSGAVLMKTSTLKHRLKLLMDGQRNLKKLDENVIMENFLSFYDTPFTSIAKKITAPTFILCGEADAMSPLNAMKSLEENLQHGSVVVMPRLGHIAPLEAPRTVGRYAKKFLD